MLFPIPCSVIFAGTPKSSRIFFAAFPLPRAFPSASKATVFPSTSYPPRTSPLSASSRHRSHPHSRGRSSSQRPSVRCPQLQLLEDALRRRSPNRRQDSDSQQLQNDRRRRCPGEL